MNGPFGNLEKSLHELKNVIPKDPKIIVVDEERGDLPNQGQLGMNAIEDKDLINKQPSNGEKVHQELEDQRLTSPSDKFITIADENEDEVYSSKLKETAHLLKDKIDQSIMKNANDDKINEIGDALTELLNSILSMLNDDTITTDYGMLPNIDALLTGISRIIEELDAIVENPEIDDKFNAVTKIQPNFKDLVFLDQPNTEMNPHSSVGKNPKINEIVAQIQELVALMNGTPDINDILEEQGKTNANESYLPTEKEPIKNSTGLITPNELLTDEDNDEFLLAGMDPDKDSYRLSLIHI